MIGHYFLSALAKFRKSPFTTAANILTLALGLACFIAAYGVASYWRSADSQHPGADRLYYVCVACEQGQAGETQSAMPLAAALRAEILELEATGRIGFPTEFAVSTGEVKTFLNAMPADAAIFSMLTFDFVEGSADTVLQRPGDIVLTQAAALRLFGDVPALGKTVLVDGQRDMIVSGVIGPIRGPSVLTDAVPADFDMFVDVQSEMERVLTAAGAPLAVMEDWTAGAVTTFVRLPPSMSREDFQTRVDALTERVMTRDANSEPVFTHTAHPLRTMTASIVDARMGMGTDLGVSTGAILTGLGLLVLIVACVNYANLAAAQTAQRVKETGMRRVLGAGRAQLLAQHLLEAGLLTAAALALAVLVVTLIAPVFRNLLGVEATYFLTAGPRGIVFLAAVSGAVAIAAAVWPALTMARVRAGDAIGAGKRRSGAGGTVSRVLVAVQFFSASLLLIVVTVTQLQYAHLRRLTFDPAEDPVIVLDGITRGVADVATLEAALRAVPEIKSMTALQFVPWGRSMNAMMLDRSGQPGAIGVRFATMSNGPHSFETFSVDVLAGRVFDLARDGSGAGLVASMMQGETPAPVSFVIDARMARALGYASPEEAVGRTLYATTSGGPEPTPGQPVGTVIGVVEADQSRLDTAYSGAAFTFDPSYEGAGNVAVRVAREDVPAAITGIQRVWDELAPDIPLRIQFNEALFEAAYAPFHVIAGVFIALSAAALLISTTGLLAVAVHVAARRRHEIGVRKTLGASTGRVLRMLIVDFSKPVLIGNLIAWPFAWMAAQTYLQPFAERAPLTPLPFVLSLGFTLLVAWIAVGGHAWRAATVKPALVLKTE
jgi:putative ABC transport system permease protein